MQLMPTAPCRRPANRADDDALVPKNPDDEEPDCNCNAYPDCNKCRHCPICKCECSCDDSLCAERCQHCHGPDKCGCECGQQDCWCSHCRPSDCDDACWWFKVSAVSLRVARHEGAAAGGQSVDGDPAGLQQGPPASSQRAAASGQAHHHHSRRAAADFLAARPNAPLRSARASALARTTSAWAT